jgi:hypothetical protein
MSPSALAIWIQHLALSFTEGSSYDRKFKFLTKKGSNVDVTMVRGSNAGVGTGDPVSDKKVKSGKKKEGKKKEGKTRKLASRKWEKGERGKGKKGKTSKLKSRETIESDEDSASSSGAASSDDEPDLSSDTETEAIPLTKIPVVAPTRVSPARAAKRKLPGHQKLKGPAPKADGRDVHPEVKSLSFQLPSMELSTLPDTWMKRDWKPGVVRSIHTIFDTIN